MRESICPEESVRPPTSHRFYDLQTHRHCSWLKPGQYQFDEVTFDFKDGWPHDLGWLEVDCPADVVEVFAALIGGNPQQVTNQYAKDKDDEPELINVDPAFA